MSRLLPASSPRLNASAFSSDIAYAVSRPGLLLSMQSGAFEVSAKAEAEDQDYSQRYPDGCPPPSRGTVWKLPTARPRPDSASRKPRIRGTPSYGFLRMTDAWSLP